MEGGRSPGEIGSQIDGTKIELELELVCQRVHLLRPVGLPYDTEPLAMICGSNSESASTGVPSQPLPVPSTHAKP